MEYIKQAVQKNYQLYNRQGNNLIPIKVLPDFLNQVLKDLGYPIVLTKEHAEEIFKTMDQNKDEVVTKQEISQGLYKILNSHGNIRKQIKCQPTQPSLYQPTSSQTVLQNQQLTYLFQKYDKNQSQFLDSNQIVPFMNQFFKLLNKNHTFSEKDSSVLICQLDNNYDKKISKQQIWKLYKSQFSHYL